MRVLVAIEPVDGRKGIDSLARLWQEKLTEEPFSGCVFKCPLDCTRYEGRRAASSDHASLYPLCGKQFDLIEQRYIFTESFVYFHDVHGHLWEIPAVWTDFVKDAYVELAAGRSPLHAMHLLELADLVEHMAKEVSCGL
jgi:hypothetical protein